MESRHSPSCKINVGRHSDTAKTRSSWTPHHQSPHHLTHCTRWNLPSQLQRKIAAASKQAKQNECHVSSVSEVAPSSQYGSQKLVVAAALPVPLDWMVEATTCFTLISPVNQLGEKSEVLASRQKPTMASLACDWAVSIPSPHMWHARWDVSIAAHGVAARPHREAHEAEVFRWRGARERKVAA